MQGQKLLCFPPPSSLEGPLIRNLDFNSWQEEGEARLIPVPKEESLRSCMGEALSQAHLARILLPFDLILMFLATRNLELEL